MGEMKPCPFCGAPAATDIGQGNQAENFDLLYRVKCGGRACAETPWFSSPVEAKKWWNTRATPSPDPRDARIAELEALAEEMWEALWFIDDMAQNSEHQVFEGRVTHFDTHERLGMISTSASDALASYRKSMEGRDDE